MTRLLAIITAAALAACWLGPAWGQTPKTRQATPPAPSWRQVPAAPGVEYAPNLNQDVFRYQKKYYSYDGKWHMGRSYQGPWAEILQPPQIFYQVEPQYFKRPPGWDRGKKTGWGPYDMPPGQAKKVYQTGPPGHSKKNKGLPPGQMKKMGY